MLAKLAIEDAVDSRMPIHKPAAIKDMQPTKDKQACRFFMATAECSEDLLPRQCTALTGRGDCMPQPDLAAHVQPSKGR